MTNSPKYYLDWIGQYGGKKLLNIAKSRLDSSDLVIETSRMNRLSKIKRIVVHGSGFQVGNVDVFRWYHQVVNGWPDIGYHFVIGNGRAGYSTEGIIEAVRSTEFQGAHVKGHNKDSIAICLISSKDFFQSTPSSPLESHAPDLR